MDGTPLRGTFYREDLQKMTVDDDTLCAWKKYLNANAGPCSSDEKGAGPNTTVGFLPKRPQKPQQPRRKPLRDLAQRWRWHSIPRPNKNNDYKVQLPYTFRCDAPDREVGLSSLSPLVVNKVRYTVMKVFLSGTKLIRMYFASKNASEGAIVSRQTDNVTIDEVIESKAVVDGASFIRRMVELLIRKVGYARHSNPVN